jgi:hypothetical protein
MRVPHFATIEQPSDVAIFEMVANDADGAPTTALTKMVGKRKDNRLLPRGWRSDGPDIAAIAPVGVDGDLDFVAGGDTIAYRVKLPEGRGRVVVRASLLYQAVPPVWVDALRGVDAEEARRFVAYYDDADKAPERVALAVRGER